MITTDTLATMNAALDGSGFHVSADGLFLRAGSPMSLRVVATPRGRVQVRTFPMPSADKGRLYWSGPAADIRRFTREFWASA